MSGWNEQQTLDHHWRVKRFVVFVTIRYLSVSKIFVEIVVLVKCHFFLIAIPNRRKGVDVFSVDLNWEWHE